MSIRVIGRLLGFLLARKKLLLQGLLLLGVISGLALLRPHIFQLMVDYVQTTRQAEKLWFYALLLVGLVAVQAVLSFWRSVIFAKVTNGGLWDLRVRMYDCLQRLPFSFHDRQYSGQTISRLTSDVDGIGRFFWTVTFMALDTVAFSVGAVVVMLVKSPRVSVLALSAMPLAVMLTARFATKLRGMFYQVRKQYGQITTVLQENIAGVQVVKAFAQEPREIDKFDKEAKTFMGQILTALYTWSFNAGLVYFVAGIGVAVLVWQGGNRVLAGELSLGMLVALNSYLLMLVMRLRAVGHIVGTTQRAVAAGDRVFELLDQEATLKEQPDARPLKPGPGRVVFENVRFSYPQPEDKASKGVLANINLTVEPGQMVALVGATGSGKTTLVNLIPRFYDVTSGRITIDGEDVREVLLTSLREDIGLVFQEPFLFSTTLAENIAYGVPEVGKESVVRVGDVAGVQAFAEGLPEGYDTVVGERGITLSGGEKQRVTIARALAVNPRILILDDSTSSVDARMERLIYQAMMRLTRGRTTFVIAHRLSTVKRADKIVVLDKGEIVEMGRHEELLQKKGRYRRIHDIQFGTEEEELL